MVDVNEVLAEGIPEVAASVPTLQEVAAQVSIVTDAHNDAATRVHALETAVFSLTSFVMGHILPHINNVHAVEALPVVDLPLPAPTAPVFVVPEPEAPKEEPEAEAAK